MSMLLMFAALTAQIPPPIIQSGPPRDPLLIAFMPGAVTCGGVAVTGTLARPMAVVAMLAPGQEVAPFGFTFRIAEDGAVLSIAPVARGMAGLYVPAEDLQPALAASRFAAGHAYQTCTVAYAAVATPVASAPIEQVYRYLALPHAPSYLEAAIRKRARDASPGCFSGKPLVVRNRAFPDYDAIPQRQGTLSMTMVGYDIDASGKTVKLRTVVSDGNAALDAAGRRAIGQSRFAPGARTGCTYPFYRRQSTPLVPPPAPPITEYRTNATCNADGGKWDLPPRMTFPEPFRRRAIEGWAVIRYDVAPWGQTGNVTVIASEPAAAFGEQARAIVQSARRPASATGATGCVERVRFKLPDGTDGLNPAQLVDG